MVLSIFCTPSFTHNCICIQGLEFEKVYRAKDKVLEAREEENSRQAELIGKLQEELKVLIH